MAAPPDFWWMLMCNKSRYPAPRSMSTIRTGESQSGNRAPNFLGCKLLEKARIPAASRFHFNTTLLATEKLTNASSNIHDVQ